MLFKLWRASVQVGPGWNSGGTQVTPLSSVSDRLHPMTPHRSGGEWHPLLVERSTLRAKAQCVFLVDVMMKGHWVFVGLVVVDSYHYINGTWKNECIKRLD